MARCSKVFPSVENAGGEAVGADCSAHPTPQRLLYVKLSKSELDWYISYKTLEIYTEQLSPHLHLFRFMITSLSNWVFFKV